MITQNCLAIKDLEERLFCLKKKYEDLTAALEQERTVAMISDEAGNLPEILIERSFIAKQIDITKARLKSREKIASKKKDLHTIGIGSKVKLQNHIKSLEIHLVDEASAQPSVGHISAISPIGKAILGKKLGEEVIVELPNGKIEYTVEKIS